MKSRELKTIKDLRKYLEEIEQQWTEKDKEYLGEFEDQVIMIPYNLPGGDFIGYGPPMMYVGLSTWFIFDIPKDKL